MGKGRIIPPGEKREENNPGGRNENEKNFLGEEREFPRGRKRIP